MLYMGRATLRMLRGWTLLENCAVPVPGSTKDKRALWPSKEAEMKVKTHHQSGSDDETYPVNDPWG